jgi:hypothetical protein
MTTTAQISVTSTATQLVPAASQYQEIHIHTTSILYVGDSTVTSSTGLRLDNGDKLTFTVSPNQALYGIVSSGTQTVYILATIL